MADRLLTAEYRGAPTKNRLRKGRLGSRIGRALRAAKATRSVTKRRRPKSTVKNAIKTVGNSRKHGLHHRPVMTKILLRHPPGGEPRSRTRLRAMMPVNLLVFAMT